MPKSKKTTLPASFAPSISLGILPNAVLPPSVLQLYFKASSERLTLCVPGTSTWYWALLFERLQLPELPSLNESVTGTSASFTIVAHDVKKSKINNVPIHFEFLLSNQNIIPIDIAVRGAGFDVYSGILSKIMEQSTNDIQIKLIMNKDIHFNKPNKKVFFLTLLYKL